MIDIWRALFLGALIGCVGSIIAIVICLALGV